LQGFRGAVQAIGCQQQVEHGRCGYLVPPAEAAKDFVALSVRLRTPELSPDVCFDNKPSPSRDCPSGPS
jgi:hypothetical protein